MPTEEYRYLETIAKEPGKCAECGFQISMGEAITLDTETHQSYCCMCGEDLSDVN